MPGVNIPQFDSLAQGLGYASVPSPGDDSSELHGTGNSQHEKDSTNDPMPITSVSVASSTEAAPVNPQTWNSGDKGTDWMGGSTLP
jgi:hypothetical protein